MQSVQDSASVCNIFGELYCVEINWKCLPPTGRLPTCLRKDGTRLFYCVSIRSLTSGYVLRYKTVDGGEKPEQKPPGDDNLSHFTVLSKKANRRQGFRPGAICWLASPTALFVCIHGLSVIELCNLQQKQLDASHWNGSAAQTHGEAQCFENTGRARLLHKNSTDPGWEIGGDHRCGGT